MTKQKCCEELCTTYLYAKPTRCDILDTWTRNTGLCLTRRDCEQIYLNHVAVVRGTDLLGHLLAPGVGLVVAGGALDVGRVALGLKPGPAHRLLGCAIRVLGVAVTLLQVHSCYSLPSLLFDKAGLLIQRCQGQLVHKFKLCIKIGWSGV